MGQMTVEQWYGTIKTGLTKKLTENKEALPAGFNQQRFILNCITVIQDMMKDDKKKAQLEKINPETIPVCLAKAAYLGLDFFNGECYAIPYGGTKDGKLNFEWLLEATEENRQKIIDEIYRRANAIWHREDWYLEDLEEAIRSTGLEVTQERVDKLLEECHRIFDDKSGRNEMLAQKASKLFEEE